MLRIINMFQGVAIVMIILMIHAQGHAQSTYVLDQDQRMKVEGTSTVHDWEMISTKAEGNAKITLENGKIAEISSLVVTLPANTLKSGKSGMDDKAYEALRIKQHPQIRFELKDLESVTDHTVIAKGNLTVAGTSRPTSVKAKYNVSGNEVRFTGSTPIKFTDFKIDPPKAVFGTIKTGDDLVISFESTFSLKN